MGFKMKKSIETLESNYLKSYPAIQNHEIDGWSVRLSPYLSPNYNCYIPLNTTYNCDLEKQIVTCEELFYKNGQMPVAKVLSNAPPKLSYILENRGYNFLIKYYVMALDLKKFHHHPVIVKSVHHNGAINDEIIEAYIKLNSEKAPKELKESIYSVLYNIKKTAICSYHTKGDNIKGTAIGVICDDNINISYIESCNKENIDTERAVIDKILQKSSERKLSHACVRVKSTDRPMIDMYSELGFETVYSYLYRQKV